MKTLRIFSLITLFLAIANLSIGQKAKTETFKVSGECGMCKKKIEKAAKDAGACFATWNIQTKMLKVTYNVSNTSVPAIQERIAGVGYDTPGYKSSDEAYNKLDACCQYERKTIKKEMGCCVAGCEMKDGKCKDEATCKAKGCCKDSEACKEKGCCGHEKTATSH